MCRKIAFLMLVIFMVFTTIFCFNDNNAYAQESEDTLIILDENGYPQNVEVNKEDDSSTEPRMMLRGTSTSTNSSIVRFKSVAQLNGSTVSYTEMDSGRTGYFNTNYSNDAAYISTDSSGRVICKLSGVVMRVPANAVKSITSYKNGNISYYKSDGTWLTHYYSYIGSSNRVVMASNRVGYKPSYLTTSKTYYSYDGHYFYTSFKDMITDYKNYKKNDFSHAVNKSNPYYNYYQFLSLRSKTTLSTSQLNSRITNRSSKLYNQASTFMKYQKEYGINASLMFGVACNESAFGISNYAKNRNNLFGLNAVDSDPGKATYFRSVDHCVSEFAYHWMSKGYLNGGDWRYRGPHLGDKHSGINVQYASDPYWGEKAASQNYFISSIKSDYQRYALGVSASTVLSMYKDANTNKRIYTTDASNGSTIFTYPVTLLDKVKGSDGSAWYKVQSDMPLKTDRTARNIKNHYDYTRDYVYSKSNLIKHVLGTIGNAPTNLKDISKATVSKINEYKYTGSQIKPTPSITLDGKTLKKDTDYTLAYKNNTKAGTATLTITGKGNYNGSKAITFTIQKRSVAEASISNVNSSYTYTGKAISPNPTVKVGGKTLVKNTDYTVTYKNNTKVGTASIVIAGKGNYSGSLTKTFKIAAVSSLKSLSKASISNVSSSYTYTRKAITPNPTVKVDKVTLKKNTDYTVSYKNNTKVGTATITIKGKGKYSGTCTKTFKISAKSLSKASISNVSSSYTYTGKSITPNPTVKVDKVTLKKNTEYTVSYKNNKKIGTATITIKGKGNYSGSLTKKFTIVKKNTLIISTISRKSYTGKQIKPTVTVKANGVTLKKNTHYTVSYGKNVNAGTGTVTVKGKGKYAGMSAKKSFIILPKQVSWNSLKSGKNSLNLSYKKITGVKGYCVGYSTKQKSGYKYVYTTSLKPTIKGLSRKTKYYVFVKAYVQANGIKYYGPESWKLIVKTK